MTDVLEKIREVFEDLMLHRTFFVSEADFQHAFAMKLANTFHAETDRIYLEFPIELDGDYVAHIDIMLMHDGKKYPIELKYKTKKTDCQDVLDNSGLMACKLLKNQGAGDLGAYDFLYDIHRIESIQEKCAGVAIILTNDPWYWTQRKRKSICDNFRISDGRTIAGELEWNIDIEQQNNPNHFTKKRPGFGLNNTYTCKWKQKSDKSEFKYLYIEVPPKK